MRWRGEESDERLVSLSADAGEGFDEAVLWCAVRRSAPPAVETFATVNSTGPALPHGSYLMNEA